MGRETRPRGLAPAWDSHAPKPAVAGDEFESMTKADLKAVAADRGISVASRWTKDELIAALRGEG